MYKFFVAPVCLVQVKSVLANFAVQRHQALVVAALYAALVAGVTAKVKHVPHMRGPQPGALVDDLRQMLVVHRLVFLGVVLALGRVAVVADNALRAVLGDAQRAVRMQRVEFIQPLLVVFQLAAVPAEIMVIAEHVGDMVHIVLHRHHGNVGDGGHAGLVHLVRQGIQVPQVVQQARALAADGDLVGNAPEADGGMIVVLHDQLLHLAAAVLVRAGGGVHHRDERDLGPHHKARAVARVIEIRAVLVMRKAHGVRAHLADKGHVLLVLLFRQRVALAQTVLMAGHAAQRREHAVEEKALLRVHRIGAHAQVGGHIVDGLVVNGEQCLHGVQVRVLHALPQVGVFNAHLRVHPFRSRTHGAGHDDARGVADDELNALALDGVCDERVQRDNGRAVLHRSGHVKALSAAIVKVKAGVLHGDEVHAAVQAAVKREVRRLGIHVVALGVVHPDGQQVLAVVQRVRHIGAEQRIAALMAGLLHTVDDDLAHAGSRLDFHIHVFARRLLNGLEIAAWAAPVVAAAVLAVQCVPAVGQVHAGSAGGNGCRGRFAAFDKGPALVDG